MLKMCVKVLKKKLLHLLTAESFFISLQMSLNFKKSLELHGNDDTAAKVKRVWPLYLEYTKQDKTINLILP